MKKALPWIRQLQKNTLAATGIFTSKASDWMQEAKDELKKVDAKYDISTKAKEAGGKIGELAQQVDQRYDIIEKASLTKNVAIEAVKHAKDVAVRTAEETGLSKGASDIGRAIKIHVARPAAEFAKEIGLDQAAIAIGKEIEHDYGVIRSIVKPYFAPETADELLKKTKRELAYISACIMQISAGEAEKVAGQFGTAIASKITGIATTGVLLSLVSSFGTAGTGTAIASLSGAAATNATLAWVGSLLGGGMATGAVLTGGLSIVVGLSAYKVLSSERRPFEDLSEAEQRLVQSCWLLIAIIDDCLNARNISFNPNVANELLTNTLLPLQKTLETQADEICTHLDGKNAVAFRQHALIDFQRVVIDGFSHFVEFGHDMPQIDTISDKSHHEEYLIGGVFYALLTRTAVGNDVESQLILAALRRANNHLTTASEAQLSDYLDDLNDAQLKGLANNVKGIYHEELWVHQYNETHVDTYAELYGDTNHPGADIQIKSSSTHEVVDEIQLKATDNVSYVNEHLERYPDIDLQVTNETAAHMDGVHSSGINNDAITRKTDHDLHAMADNTMSDRALHSAEYASAIAFGHGLVEMLRGNKEFPQAVTDTVKRVGTATAATAVAAYLFG
jgi:hypothetical protein